MAYGKILVDQVENSDGKSLNVGPGARVFDTVAELQASTTLSDGDLVIVKERANAKYIIQPSTYSDLGGDLSLTSGQFAELQLGPINDVRWWGAKGDLFNPDGTTNESPTDDSSYIQDAAWRIHLSKSGMMLDGSGLGYSVSTGIKWSQGNSGMQNFYFAPTDDFSSEDTGEAIIRTASGLGICLQDIRIACNGMCNGVYNESGGFENKYLNLKIDEFVDFGILTEGGGGQIISHCQITQYAEVSDRTGVCVDIQSGDAKIFNSVIRYAYIPLRINGNTTMVGDCHFYNGSATSSTAATNSWNIQIVGGSGHSFSHIYLDKGRILMQDSFGASFSSMKYLFNSTPEHDSIFVLNTSEEDTEWPSGFSHSGIGSKSTVPLNNGDMKFVTLNSEGGGYWSSSAESIKDEINLRSFGLPNIGTEITCNVKPELESCITTGSTQSIKHSVSDNSYSENGYGGVLESYSTGEVRYAASGMSHVVDSVGDFTEAGMQLIGSRTGPTSVASIEMFNRQGSSTFDYTSSTMWSFNMVGRSGGFTDYLDLYTSDVDQSDETVQYRFSQDYFAPMQDGVPNLGTGSYRWANIYAINSTISTSDARLKTDLAELTDDEINAAVAISKAMGYTWQWLEDGDRTHTGPTVQLIMGIMEDNNLTPFDYSFICYDEWEDQVEQVEVTPEVLDKDGNVVTEAVYKEKVVLEAGDRYSFRENELVKFCNAGLSARLDSQQEAIDSILSRLDSLEG